MDKNYFDVKNNAVGGDNMKEGTVEAALGTVVTAGAIALRAMDIKDRGFRRRDIIPKVETAFLGFGLAHIVLGTIDLLQDRRP